jgi:hypothetical protein
MRRSTGWWNAATGSARSVRAPATPIEIETGGSWLAMPGVVAGCEARYDVALDFRAR